MSKKENIVLCGFMGCGKSTVGALLAKKTGMSFVDLDTYIENKAGMTVSEIFAQYGEAHFRALEREASKELAAKSGVVLAAGGGTLTFSENVEILKQGGSIVLLDLPVKVVAERLKNDKTRPLLNQPDKDKVMKELYEKRLPLYRQAADYTVDAAQSPLQVCAEIMDTLGNH